MATMRRCFLRWPPFVLVALGACAAPQDDEEPSGSIESELATKVVAPNVARLVPGPSNLTASMRDGTVSVLSPTGGALTPVPNRTGYLAASDVSFSFSGSPNGGEAFLYRKDASGASVKVTRTFYRPQAIGFDAQYFYFVTQRGDSFYADRSIFRIGFEPGAVPKEIGDVGNGENAPDPLATLVANGGVFWTTLPNTCSLGSGSSCWEVAVGRATDGNESRTLVKPRLADGTYVGLSALTFYQGDLYAASSRGIYKAAGGDITKPFQQVCGIPPTFRVKLSGSTVLVPSSAGFAASSRGFVVPLQTEDYRSALGLVTWSCATEVLTSYGPPATGSVKTYGVTQIREVVVRGNSIFWLDRQSRQAGDEYADLYYSLKRTTF